MKRFAIVALLSALAACGGDSGGGPSATFTGTWTGYALENMDKDTLYLSFTSTQTGSAISGTGSGTESGSTGLFTFTGTSTPPTVNFTFTIGITTLTYAGSYARSDSVAGTLSNGSSTLPLGLKRN